MWQNSLSDRDLVRSGLLNDRVIDAVNQLIGQQVRAEPVDTVTVSDRIGIRRHDTTCTWTLGDCNGQCKRGVLR